MLSLETPQPGTPGMEPHIGFLLRGGLLLPLPLPAAPPPPLISLKYIFFEALLA